MEYKIDLLQDKNIVLVEMNGRLNFHIAAQYSKQAVTLARKNNCSKFLIDHSGTILNSEVNQIFATAEELRQFGFTNSDKVAILIGNSSDVSVNPKSVDNNIHFSNLKIFLTDEYDESVDWLLESN